MRRMLCIGLLLATLTISASVRAETITIRADEWLPYNGPSTLRPAGYMIDLAMRIAKDHGHTIDYRHLPWDDALAAVKKGEFDCVVGANEEEAEGMVLPGLSWGSSQSVAYTLEGSKQVIGSIEAIKAKRLIYIPGYSYGEELDPWIEQNAGNPAVVVPVTSGGRAAMSAISKLVAKLGDVFVEDRNVIAHNLKQLDMVGRLKAQVVVDEEPTPIFIACTKANLRGAQFTSMFEEGTRQLRASGELGKILEPYGLTDWESAQPEQ